VSVAAPAAGVARRRRRLRQRDYVPYLFILPNIQESLRFGTGTLETIVAAVVGFYFGARS